MANNQSITEESVLLTVRALSLNGKSVSMESIAIELYTTYNKASDVLKLLENKGLVRVDWQQFPKWSYVELL
jgi:Mn-dependent DtxR family transcriptional regulator